MQVTMSPRRRQRPISPVPPRGAGIELGGPAATTVVIAVVAVLARVAFVHDPPSPDEGGYLVVARNWSDGGPFSYGYLFVDRPPVLLLVFRLASLLGGITPLRWIGCAGVVVAVVAAGWAGVCLGGRRGARWAALVAAALMTTPMLGAHEVDGELIAAPLVLLSCACLLQGLRRLEGANAAAWAGAAGLTGTLALLVKQNFVDALAFGVVVLAAAMITRRVSPRQIAASAAGYLTGMLLPIAAVLVWATTRGPGIGSLLYATYGFRSDATHTLLSYSFAAPGKRLHELAGVALLSGIVMFAALFVARLVARSPRAPEALGVAAMFVTSSAGVLLGLSYWMHYLIQLVPAVALASASLSREQGRTVQIARIAVVYVVLTSLVSTGLVLFT
ncbi:MAG: hypothetical protein H0V07_00485, partial [Propionibacteriales bacterium]|nr:hypothetical protein [Propionibacteriales bacterium]